MELDRAIVSELVDTLDWCQSETGDAGLRKKANELRVYLVGLLISTLDEREAEWVEASEHPSYWREVSEDE